MCPDWNQLFQDPSKIVRDPDLLAKEFTTVVKPGSQVLDLGCGAGRHLIFMTGEGLRPVGVDISPVGLGLSEQWLSNAGLRAGLVLSPMDILPFASSTFDGVISINVLNHAPVAQTERAVEEVHQILKPGSPFFILIIGREDVRCGEGLEIEPSTFVHQEGIEAGVPHQYYDRAEVQQLMKAFRRIRITERRRVYNDRDPVFGNEPRARGKADAVVQHWAV